MVAREGKYYGDPLKRSRGFTQGNPLYPTILNIVVDAFIRHWVMVVAGEDAGPEGFGRTVQKLAALLYAENRLLMSLQRSRLQEALEVLMGMFYMVRVVTNADKKVGMVCQTCRTASRK